MPGNNDPLFSRLGDVTSDAATGMGQSILLAAADYTGIGANNRLVWTADATNGGFIQRLRFKATSTNVAAVMRIYINNGATNATATNNVFYGEVNLPATTAATTTGTPDVDYPMNFALPAGFRIYCGLGAAVAGGWTVMPVAGKY